MGDDRSEAHLRPASYPEERQRLFVTLSGDNNPLHVDALAARRTLIGACAVHGIHLALGGIEAALVWLEKQGRAAVRIAGFKAQFLKPVVVGESVEHTLSALNESGCRVAIKSGEAVACKLIIDFGVAGERPDEDSLPALREESIVELSFPAIGENSGRLPIGLDSTLARQMFPLATLSLGKRGMAQTVALSRIVGVRCPGLHSIFGQATVQFAGTGERDCLDYRVDKADERFRRVEMSVRGTDFQASLIAYVRPPPVVQPGMAEVRRVVGPGDFAGSVALIVGASRGLGEITARIIAAGGGLPVLTYQRGKADAEKIAEEIRAHGGQAETLQLDVLRNDLAEQLAASGRQFRTLYYFATPKISKISDRGRAFFDLDLLRAFQEIYVHAFARLVDLVAPAPPARLWAFYPSSVTVDEKLREFAEYTLAKRSGEEMCTFYNAHSDRVGIVVERLPRIRTDQTMSLLPSASEEGLGVMLPLVRQLESRAATA